MKNLHIDYIQKYVCQVYSQWKSKLILLWSLLCVYYNIILNFTLAGFHHASFSKPPWFFISYHPSCLLDDERILCDHIMVYVLKWLKARIYLAMSRSLITSWSLSPSPSIRVLYSPKRELLKLQYILPCPEMRAVLHGSHLVEVVQPGTCQSAQIHYQQLLRFYHHRK